MTEHVPLPSFINSEQKHDVNTFRVTTRVAEPEILQFVRLELDKFNQVHERVRKIKKHREEKS